MAATCVVVSILASGVTAHAETDVFMRTVGFASPGGTTRSEGDRRPCEMVFAINNDIFRQQRSHRPHHNTRTATATGMGAMGYGRIIW